MTRLKWMAGAALAAAAMAAAPMAQADEGLTTRSGVIPMVDNGRLVGCQAPFEVVRADPEYSGGRRVRVEGRLSVISPSGTAGVMLQMAVHGPDDAEGADGTVPAVLVIRDGAADSSAERYHPEDKSDDTPLIYTLGPVTRAALSGAVADGRFTLAYALREGGPMAPLTVDLTVTKRSFGGAGERNPGAPQALADCLRRLRLTDLTR